MDSAGSLHPAVDRARSGGAFVGRRDELGVLGAAWEEAGGDAPVGLVLVRGEPGAGKTRLSAEQAARVHAEGGWALFGRCDPEVPAPFRPWLGILGDLARTVPKDVLAAHGAPLARLIGPVAGNALPVADPAEADAERHRMLAAAVALIGAAAERQPLLIVLDDLHVADRSSLLLLRALLEGPNARVLVLATVRDSSADDGEPFRDAVGTLLRHPAARVIELGGLDLEDTRALVGDDELARRLHADTEGNALFTVELMRHLSEQRAPIVGTLPATVTEVIRRRAAQLGEETARTARFAAALGRTFDFNLLVHVTQEDEDTVLDAVERCCSAALVAEVRDRPGSFQFSHALVQQVLAGELSEIRRRKLHRRAAEYLAAGERDAVRTGEMALHWASAGSDFVEQAVAAAVEAGEQALAVLALDDAVRAFARALELHEDATPEPDDQTTELLLRLGDAERRAGHEGYSDRLLAAADLAERRGDTDRLVRAAIANSRGIMADFRVTDERRVGVLEAALGAVPEEAVRERALLLAVLASEVFADRARRLTLADAALEAARAAGDPEVLAEVLYRRCLTIAEPDTVTERLQLTAELRRLGERLRDPMVRLRAGVEGSRVLFEAGRADAIPEAESVIELAPETGSTFAGYLASNLKVILLQREGRYEEAEVEGLRAAQRGAALVPDAYSIFGAVLVQLRYDQGRLGELGDWAASEAQAADVDLGHRALVPLALSEAGRPDDARAALDAAAAEGLPVNENVLLAVSAMLWAEAALRLEHKAAAELSLERLTPWREQYVFSGVALMGSVARMTAGLAALLGRHEDAARDFALAETVDGRIGAVGPLARTWIDHGRWLLARGDEEQGRARIERGRSLAAEHALGGLVALADAAIGVEVAAAPAGITRAALVREGDVWTLEFDGRTTRLKDAKGLHYIVALLRTPGVEQHALDLVGGGGNGASASAEGLEVRADTGDAGPALDDQAKAQYRSRLAELREELEEAESFNDPERAARAREELEWIGQALSQAVGLGGRDRPQASGAERARVNVTRAIKAVVKRIAEHDDRAARVLDTDVRTGLFCVYEPDPDRPVDWSLPD